MADLPPLVGRDDELAVLQQRLEAVLRGQGALVLISGEMGIGKTSLAMALGQRAQAAGAAFAVGRCYESGAAPALAPWRDLLADLQAYAWFDLTALPQPFGDGPSAESAYQLMQSVVGVLRTATSARPAVLLLDDLHWADRDTLELLAIVTRHVHNLPLAVVVTYRSEAVQRRHPLYDFLPRLHRNRPVETLRLGALSAADAGRLVESRYGRCSESLAAYLRARSEGNPLFLVELLRDLTEQELLPEDDQGQLLPPPGNAQAPALLQQVITQRVERLGAEVERLLGVAAVVGEEWELAVVEVVLGWAEEPLLQALDDALAAKVILPADERTERYRFAHVMIREVFYTGQLARRRKHLHARAGAALEALAASGREVAERANALAYHFHAAEHWVKAAQYGLAAGDTARDRFASHSALLLYQQALDAAQRAPTADPELLLALHERLGQVHMVLNQRDQAESAFTRMLQVAQARGDSLAEGRALYWLSYIRARLYRMAEARATAEAALRAAGQVGNPRLLALTHWNLGHLYLVGGELEHADRYFQQAEQFAREGGEHDVRGRCLQDLALLRAWEGFYARAELLAYEALALARASHDTLVIASAYFRLGLACGELGRYARARQAIQSGLEHAEEAGDDHNRVKLLNLMGWLHCELGDFEAALRWNQQALDVSRRTHSDRVSEAERYTLLDLATDELYAGHVDKAEAYLGDFDHVLDDNEHARFRYLNRYQLVRAEVSLTRGQLDAALRWSQEAAALATAKGVRKNVAKSRLLGGRALLALRRPREAAELLRQAVALADELRHGSLRWQARLWLGQACGAQGEPAAASDLYRQALDHVTTIATELEDERRRSCLLSWPLVEELRAAAATAENLEEQPAAPHAPRALSPAGLTPREVDVLRLVAQGATNAAIATTLRVSVKTVEVHMTSILGKTECTNRVAAATFALRHGLA